MMTRVRSARVVFIAVLVLQVVPTAARVRTADPRAQVTNSTAGAVTGTIIDATGAVLSGVTVTISGTALMGTRTATSSSEGLYRFPAVPPGDYSLFFSRPGFTTTTRDGIHIGSGFIATVDVMLSVEGLQADLSLDDHRPAVNRDQHPLHRATAFGSTHLGKRVWDSVRDTRRPRGALRGRGRQR